MKQGQNYLNRGTVARAVRSSTIIARRRSVLYRELAQAKRRIPRGHGRRRVPGRDTAIALLDAMEAALRARKGEIRGTSGRLVRDLIAAGLLDLERAPSPGTIRRALALLADATSLVRRDGPRTWLLDLAERGDPDEVEQQLEVARRPSEAPLFDDPIDASSEVDPPLDGPQIDACDVRAGPIMRRPVATSKHAVTGRSRQLRPNQPRPRTRARTGQDLGAVPSGMGRDAPTPHELLAMVPRRRWLRLVAAACLRRLESAPDLRGVYEVCLPEGRTAGARWRASAWRAVQALARRGWLAQGPDGWTVRPTAAHPDLELLGVRERPETRPPSPRMRRHLVRIGVDPAGLGAGEAMAVQRRAHLRRRQDLLGVRQLRAVVEAGGGQLAEFDLDALLERRRADFGDLLRGVTLERRLDLRLAPLPRLVAPAAERQDHPGMASSGRDRWSKIIAAITKRHGGKVAYAFEVTGGGGELPTLVRDAHDEDIEPALAVIAETEHPAALSRRVEDFLRRAAEVRVPPYQVAVPDDRLRLHWLRQVEATFPELAGIASDALTEAGAHDEGGQR